MEFFSKCMADRKYCDKENCHCARSAAIARRKFAIATSFLLAMTTYLHPLFACGGKRVDERSDVGVSSPAR